MKTKYFLPESTICTIHSTSSKELDGTRCFIRGIAMYADTTTYYIVELAGCAQYGSYTCLVLSEHCLDAFI